jgi:hypothetical protein
MRTSGAAAVAWLLGIAAAMAFDTGKLGQRGTLALSDIMPVIAKSARLQREVAQALTQNHKKRDEVNCDGMRFPGQWVNLGGERVSPYICDFGGKWLRITATVRVTDRRGRVFDAITPEAMKNATTVAETSPAWNWTTEDPFKDE